MAAHSHVPASGTLLLLFVVGGAAVACKGSSVTQANDLDVAADASSALADASVDAEDGGCILSGLALLIDVEQGVATRLHVPVTYKEAAAVLLVDTGSGLTFLQEPLGTHDPVEDAGVLQLGCLALDVIGRPEIADTPVNGLPSVGTLGTDLLLAGPSEIDLLGSQILFHHAGVPFAGANGWPQAPFDLVAGAVIPHVQLNGVAAELILDTGSQDTLWVGQPPQPGDIEVDTTDAYGNVVKLYEGTVELTIGTAMATVPVLRAPSFPSFQPPEMGVVGLLGLSSLGRGVVIDSDARVVHVDM